MLTNAQITSVQCRFSLLQSGGGIFFFKISKGDFMFIRGIRVTFRESIGFKILKKDLKNIEFDKFHKKSLKICYLNIFHFFLVLITSN